MTSLRHLVGAAIGAGALLVPTVASAATVSLPVEIDNGAVLWGNLTGDSGFYIGSADCTGGDAFVMAEAYDKASDLSDTHDDGGAVVINGVNYDFEADVDVTGNELTGPDVTMDGLTVAVKWTTAANAQWIRQTIAVTNPEATAKDATLAVESNVGSDDETELLGSGDGWFATSDDAVDADLSDPANGWITHGVGTDHAGTTTVDCNDSELIEANVSGNESFSVDFATVSVPAGATVRFVLFYGVFGTNAAAVSFGANADYDTAKAAGMFAGFTDAELATILNWNATAQLPTTGSSTLPVLGTALGLALAGAFIATLRRRSIA